MHTRMTEAQAQATTCMHRSACCWHGKVMHCWLVAQVSQAGNHTCMLLSQCACADSLRAAAGSSSGRVAGMEKLWPCPDVGLTTEEDLRSCSPQQALSRLCDPQQAC